MTIWVYASASVPSCVQQSRPRYPGECLLPLLRCRVEQNTTCLEDLAILAGAEDRRLLRQEDPVQHLEVVVCKRRRWTTG